MEMGDGHGIVNRSQRKWYIAEYMESRNSVNMRGRYHDGLVSDHVYVNVKTTDSTTFDEVSDMPKLQAITHRE